MGRDNIKILLVLLTIALVICLGYLIHWYSSMLRAEDLYEAGRFVEAEELMLRNISAFPDFLPGREKEFMRIGEIEYLKGEIIKAEKYFHQALNIDNKLSLPLYRLGTIRDKEGRYSLAIDYLERALSGKMEKRELILEINERLASVLYRYAMQHQIYRQDDNAMEYYKKAVKIYPDFPEALHSLGDIYYQKKKYKEAWEYYRKALELNPDLSFLYQGVGNLFLKLGKTKEANFYNDRYLELLKDTRLFVEEDVLEDNDK